MQAVRAKIKIDHPGIGGVAGRDFKVFQMDEIGPIKLQHVVLIRLRRRESDFHIAGVAALRAKRYALLRIGAGDSGYGHLFLVSARKQIKYYGLGNTFKQGVVEGFLYRTIISTGTDGVSAGQRC